MGYSHFYPLQDVEKIRGKSFWVEIKTGKSPISVTGETDLFHQTKTEKTDNFPGEN